MKNRLADAVRRHFNYLLDAWGFTIVNEQIYPESFGNAIVELRSASIGILVSLDRGQVFVDIGPVSDLPSSWQDMCSILAFIAPQIADACYRSPAQKASPADDVDSQAANLAGLLHRYGTMVLEGQFTDWDKAKEAAGKKVEEEYQRLTGKPFPKPILSHSMAAEEVRRQGIASGRRR